MAEYHAHGSISHGACATFAYDLRETITDPLTKELKDYTHKEDLLYKNSYMPENAPKEWTEHPELCWQSVAEREGMIDPHTGKAAQHARKIEFALPKELTTEQQIRVCDKLAQFYAKMGMCVSYGLHNTPNGNVHCHMIVTLRGLKEDGTWAEAKNKSVFSLDKNGERIPQLDKKKVELWEKEHEKKFDLNTATQEDKDFCQKVRERKNKGKEKMWVREVQSVTGWDTNEFYKKNVRKKIEKLCNAALRLAGRSERVDCRSYEERKINKKATIHEGYNKTVKAERSEYNERVRTLNAKTETWEQLQEELLRRLAKEAAEKAAKRGEKYHTIAEPVIDDDSQRPEINEVEEVIDDVRAEKGTGERVNDRSDDRGESKPRRRRVDLRDFFAGLETTAIEDHRAKLDNTSTGEKDSAAGIANSAAGIANIDIEYRKRQAIRIEQQSEQRKRAALEREAAARRSAENSERQQSESKTHKFRNFSLRGDENELG